MKILLLSILLFSGSLFADVQEQETAGINRWAKAFGIEIATQLQFASQGERGDFGYALPRVSFQIANGLTCFYQESSLNYIYSRRPDWYMACGPNPYYNERYVRRYPHCGTYDYTEYERAVNCFRDAGTDNSQALQCYQAKGRSSRWTRINCTARD